jgi:RNA polymerase sigma factor for flagellar operon FliA
MQRRLLHEIDRLPAVEQTVVRHHYLMDIPFADIAALLRLSKGRISQLHKSALAKLKDRIKQQAGGDR